MADTPAGGGGTSNAFPLTIIVLLIIFALFNPGAGSGGNRAASLDGSDFVLEAIPAAQEAAGRADFIVSYENASNRVLNGAVVRVIVPEGAEFDFAGSGGRWRSSGPAAAEYPLSRIAPREKGEIRFLENIDGGKRGAVQETVIVLVWNEMPSTWKRSNAEAVVSGQAVVRANVLVRAATEGTTALADTDVAETGATTTNTTKKGTMSGVKGTLASLASANAEPLISPIIGWGLFLILVGSIIFLVVRIVKKVLERAREDDAKTEQASLALARQEKWKEFQEEKKDIKREVEEEIKTERKYKDDPFYGQSKKDVPPDNLPI